MATFSYSFLTLLQNTEMSPSKITPSIHLSIPPSLYPSFSVSILQVPISERLLLLLMGDVNHRCANNIKKHVRTTTSEKEIGRVKRKEGCCCCCLFQHNVGATYTRTARPIHVHLTLFVVFFLLFCYIRVIFTSWYPSLTGDDERRAKQRCLQMHARANLE